MAISAWNKLLLGALEMMIRMEPTFPGGTTERNSQAGSRSVGRVLLMAICIATGVVVLSGSIQAADWPQWRGPERDGRSPDHGLLKAWPEGGPPLAWRASGLGGGYSSVAVAGDRVYTMGDFGDAQYAIASAARTAARCGRRRSDRPGRTSTWGPGRRRRLTASASTWSAPRERSSALKPAAARRSGAVTCPRSSVAP